MLPPVIAVAATVSLLTFAIASSPFSSPLLPPSSSPPRFTCFVSQVAGEAALCGVVTKDTKFAFRSRSAHFTVVVLMSREMWDFALDGNLYFEKVSCSATPSILHCEYSIG